MTNYSNLFDEMTKHNIARFVFTLYFESDEVHASEDFEIIMTDGNHAYTLPEAFSNDYNFNDIAWALYDYFGERGIFELDAEKRIVYRSGDAYFSEPELYEEEYIDAYKLGYALSNDGMSFDTFTPLYPFSDNDNAPFSIYLLLDKGSVPSYYVRSADPLEEAKWVRANEISMIGSEEGVSPLIADQFRYIQWYYLSDNDNNGVNIRQRASHYTILSIAICTAKDKIVYLFDDKNGEVINRVKKFYTESEIRNERNERLRELTYRNNKGELSDKEKLEYAELSKQNDEALTDKFVPIKTRYLIETQAELPSDGKLVELRRSQFWQLSDNIVSYDNWKEAREYIIKYYGSSAERFVLHTTEEYDDQSYYWNWTSQTVYDVNGVEIDPVKLHVILEDKDNPDYKDVLDDIIFRCERHLEYSKQRIENFYKERDNETLSDWIIAQCKEIDGQLEPPEYYRTSFDSIDWDNKEFQTYAESVLEDMLWEDRNETNITFTYNDLEFSVHEAPKGYGYDNDTFDEARIFILTKNSNEIDT